MIYLADAPPPHEYEVMLAAARQLGLDPSDARLASASARFIWHLPAAAAALVVTRPGNKTAGDIAAETAAVRAATAAGVRTPPMLAEPIPVAERRFGLAYGWIDGHAPEAGDWPAAAAEAAKLARAKDGALRRLSWPVDWPAPAWLPILGQRLQTIIAQQCDRAASAVEVLARSAGDFVLCHGDLQPSNIIIDGAGYPWLIDMESACLAPPEWDPAKLIILANRFGSPERIDEVLKAWPALDSGRVTVCASVQETQIVGWLVQMAIDGTPGAVAEARRRARTLGGEARPWRHLR